MIIAEIGANHDGSVVRAKQLVREVSQLGADSCKFQLIFPEELYVPYLRSNAGEFTVNPAHDQRKFEQLTRTEWASVWEYANSLGIDVSASIFGAKSLELLKFLGASWVKISSSDFNNRELIYDAALNFSEVIVSTGMASNEELIAFREWWFSLPPGRGTLKLMHCVSLYPCPLPNANLARYDFLLELFPNCEIGYSDHTQSEHAAVALVGKGCALFEKHYTDNTSRPGFDHKYAADFTGFERYVSVINQTKLAFKPSEDEIVDSSTRNRARRGIYATGYIPKGTIISRAQVKVVRPSTFLSVVDIDKVLGLPAAQDLMENDALNVYEGAVVSEKPNQEALNFWVTEMKEKGM